MEGFTGVLYNIFDKLFTPFEYFEYIRSPYYKKEKKEFFRGITHLDGYDEYNLIEKYDLPIRYVHNPQDDFLEAGWFVMNNTLIIPGTFLFVYDHERGTWEYLDEDENEQDLRVPIDEYFEREIRKANELSGQELCISALYLASSFSVDEPDLVSKEKRFVIYDGNDENGLKKALFALCGRR